MVQTIHTISMIKSDFLINDKPPFHYPLFAVSQLYDFISNSIVFSLHKNLNVIGY